MYIFCISFNLFLYLLFYTHEIFISIQQTLADHRLHQLLSFTIRMSPDLKFCDETSNRHSDT